MKEIFMNVPVEVKYQADVCVIGAGPAGCAAATSAALQGSKVLLLENGFMCGGMSTAGRVPVFMPVSDGIHLLCEGYGRQILTALRQESSNHGFSCGGAINAEHLRFVYEKLLEDAGVSLLYGCRFIHAICEDKTIRQAVFASPGGMFAVEAPVFIDATGDGVVAADCGAEFSSGGEEGDVMPATLCSVWTGFDWDEYCRGGAFSHNDEKMPVLLENAFQTGELEEEDYHLTGITRVSKFTAVGNLSHVFQIDSTDAKSLTDGLRRNRKLLRQYEAFYRNHIKGFEQAEIIDSGSVLGIRESRRILGDYVLSRSDYAARRNFDDEIGRYNFPADIHPSRPGKQEILTHKRIFQESRYAKGESYGIPYRCLLPKSLNNLLVCGRCVSTDRYVYASLRVIPACYITGQAAGFAAAIAVNSKVPPRQIDFIELQRLLPERRPW